MGETELCSTLSLFIRALLKIGRRGTAPVKETLAVYGSGEFLYAYGTQANANQIGLLHLLRDDLLGIAIDWIRHLSSLTSSYMVTPRRRWDWR